MLEKATRQHTKDHNSRLVLRTIYESGEVSRAELARQTQLTRTTVSDVVSDLIERGLVEETGHGPIGVGRTPILLSVVDDARLVAAVSVTAEALNGALVNLRGGVSLSMRSPLSSHDGEILLASIYAMVQRLISAADRPLLGIGIDTPGLIDTSSGTVLRAVTFGWENLPLGVLLRERFGLPASVANDSHSLALAEYMFGRQPSAASLVVLKVGQGIGAGIVLDGRLYAGEGYGAGEIGHLVVQESGERCKCGNVGCLETVAGVGVLLREARALGAAKPRSPLGRIAASSAPLTVQHVADAAADGDRAAAALIERIGGALAIAVAAIVSVLNVRRIVITGRVAPLGEPLATAVRVALARRTLPALAAQTVIDVQTMPAQAPLLGAASPLLTDELGLARMQQR